MGLRGRRPRNPVDEYRLSDSEQQVALLDAEAIPCLVPSPLVSEGNAQSQGDD